MKTVIFLTLTIIFVSLGVRSKDFCPQKLFQHNTTWRNNICCSSADCPFQTLCCDEKIGNMCRFSVKNKTNGVEVKYDPSCELGFVDGVIEQKSTDQCGKSTALALSYCPFYFNYCCSSWDCLYGLFCRPGKCGNVCTIKKGYRDNEENEEDWACKKGFYGFCPSTKLTPCKGIYRNHCCRDSDCSSDASYVCCLQSCGSRCVPSVDWVTNGMKYSGDCDTY